MRSDIDYLMEARDLDAILVGGKVLGNPPLIYLLKGARLTHATLVKKRGESPVLIVSPMEREEAEAAGYPTRLATRYDYAALLREHGDPLLASVAYYRRIFDDLGVTGRVGFYGYLDQGSAYTLLSALDAALVGIEVVGEFDDTILQAARATKELGEVARIREAGRRTANIVRQTVAFLQGHAVAADETLRTAEGRVLTVGDVHAHIRDLVARAGMEDPEGFIFAIGRDAGIPHSRGNPQDKMRLGRSIVFDIFPREAGGGYFFDMTRTFCLGYAPEPVAALHQDVLDCLEHIKARIRPGELARSYQQATCEFFAERGHPTLGETPDTLQGYVHSLGHGVGLDIHEAPMFRDTPSNTAMLELGHVFTLEPGLYYPERGMGCRLEDVIWMDAEGAWHNLTDYPYELVIPMERM